MFLFMKRYSVVQNLRKLFRTTELFWLGVALALSVTALTSVTFLTDRLHQAFERDARQLIASDLIIQSDQELTEDFLQEADRLELQIARTVVFPTMASHVGQSKLTTLKAVTSNYPLRGVLTLRGHSPGLLKDEVWIDPALMITLKIQIGSQIELGDKKFTVADVIDQELDRGAGFMNFAPRVMIRLEDLEQTGLVSFGSRVNYRLLVAAPKNLDDASGQKRIQLFADFANKKIQSENLKGLRIETVENGQPLMRKTLERAERFLALIALLTSMVAAVGVALTSQRYAYKQSEVCAIWRCLGASQSQILWNHAKKFIQVSLLAGIFGVCAGWMVHYLLMVWIGDLLMHQLPLPSIWPAVWGVLVSLTLFFGFAWPPLLALSKTSPIKALRKDYANYSLSIWQSALCGLSSFCILLGRVAKDIQLASIVLVSFIVASAVFLLLGIILSRFVGRWLVCIPNLRSGIRFAGFRLLGTPWMTALQITSLGVALMALLLLIVIRQNLLGAWQASVPVDAPNRFIINIQSDQKEEVFQALTQHRQKNQLDFYPMIRGRLIEINKNPITATSYQEDNAQRLVDREFNLSYSDTLPIHNKIVQGKWHFENVSDIHQISMEQGVMKTLKLKLGDLLTFDVAGQIYEVRITSVRKLDWSSMHVNFFAIMPKALLEEAPKSWITAYKQEANIPEDMNLVAHFPNLTVIDVDASLRQVQSILSKLILAIQLLFLFTLIAGIFVLASGLATSQELRMKEAAVLKTMGADKKFLLRAWRTELLFIGTLSGVLSGFFASLTAYLLAKYVLDIEMPIPIGIIFIGVVLGNLASLLAGYWIHAKILKTRPILILRDG